MSLPLKTSVREKKPCGKNNYHNIGKTYNACIPSNTPKGTPPRSDIGRRIKAALSTDKDVGILWVRSHIGIKGNETADKRAEDEFILGDISGATQRNSRGRPRHQQGRQEGRQDRAQNGPPEAMAPQLRQSGFCPVHLPRRATRERPPHGLPLPPLRSNPS